MPDNASSTAEAILVLAALQSTSGLASITLLSQQATAETSIDLDATHVTVPDATADGDALNRQTADARYALVAPSSNTLTATTTDATPTVMLVGGSGYLTVDDDTAWNFRAEIVGLTADAVDYAAYTVTGLVRRSNNTVTVHGVTVTTLTESVAGWDATAVADDTNKALSIKVTGAASTLIVWSAETYITKCTFVGTTPETVVNLVDDSANPLVTDTGAYGIAQP